MHMWKHERGNRKFCLASNLLPSKPGQPRLQACALHAGIPMATVPAVLRVPAAPERGREGGVRPSLCQRFGERRSNSTPEDGPWSEGSRSRTTSRCLGSEIGAGVAFEGRAPMWPRSVRSLAHLASEREREVMPSVGVCILRSSGRPGLWRSGPGEIDAGLPGSSPCRRGASLVRQYGTQQLGA